MWERERERERERVARCCGTEWRSLAGYFSWPMCLFQTTLDQQVKELSDKLNEEVANATKAAKRDLAKLQGRVSHA